MSTGPELLPFAYRDGRLCLEDVDLTDLAASLDGRAAWLVSHAAVEAGLAGASRDGPCCVPIGTVGPLAVLALASASGWWARVRSAHELTLALEAGFPPERIVAGSGVRDDGFVKDALSAGVAVIEHGDATERAQAERIASLLGHDLPPGDGAPPDAPPEWLAHCGGLLAPVLRPPPALAIDAVCPRFESGPRAYALHVEVHPSGAPLEAPLVDGMLAGLDSGIAPQPALVPAQARRGDWVVLPGAAAALRPIDPAHPAARTVLVRGPSWRLLGARPLPPELD